MTSAEIRSDGLTVVLAAKEASGAIDDAVVDQALEVVKADAAVGLDIAGSPAVLMSCARVGILRHPANPLVYLVAEGDEDEVRWATNKVTTDGWADLGLEVELPSGELAVLDALGSAMQTIGDLPPGAYRLLEYRGDSSWICLLAQKGFWDRLD